MEKVILIGNIGSDPSLRDVNDTVVANFSLGVESEQNIGDQKRITHWYKIAAWGKLGSNLVEYQTKGNKLYIEGTMVSNEYGSPRTWSTEDGEPRAQFEVRADKIKYLDRKGAVSGGATAADDDPFAQEEDDIPF